MLSTPCSWPSAPNVKDDKVAGFISFLLGRDKECQQNVLYWHLKLSEKVNNLFP